MAIASSTILIGIAGTNGSGKDTIGSLLMNNYNFMFISVSDILRAELQRQGLSTARENARDLSANWRRQYGLGVLITKAQAIFEASQQAYNGLAIASLRNPGEVDEVHKLGGKVLWVDADPKLRYQRIQQNLHLRGATRQENDNKSFAEFMAEELIEMNFQQGSDQASLSMQAVKDKSDLFIDNAGNNLTELSHKLAQVLDL